MYILYIHLTGRNNGVDGCLYVLLVELVDFLEITSFLVLETRF